MMFSKGIGGYEEDSNGTNECEEFMRKDHNSYSSYQEDQEPEKKRREGSNFVIFLIIAAFIITMPAYTSLIASYHGNHKEAVEVKDEEPDVTEVRSVVETSSHESSTNTEVVVEEKTPEEQDLATCSKKIKYYKEEALTGRWSTLHAEKQVSLYKMLKYELKHPDMTEEEQVKYNELRAEYEKRLQEFEIFKENHPYAAPAPTPYYWP